jgi:hypothetical protein
VLAAVGASARDLVRDWTWLGRLSRVQEPEVAAERLGRIAAESGSRPSLLASFDAALEIAELSGLPPELVALHREAHLGRLAAAAAVIDASHLHDLDFGGLGVGDAASGPPDRAPSFDHASGGLLLAPAETAAIDGAVLEDATVRAIAALRVGAAPDPRGLWTAAVDHWRRRTSGAMDTSGSEAETAQREIARIAVERESGHRDRRDLLARALAEVEVGYREALFLYRIGQHDLVVAADLYNGPQAGNLGDFVVTAGFNYLRALLSKITVEPIMKLPLTMRAAYDDVGRHMDLTVPQRWSSSAPSGAQSKRTQMAAVALVARDELDRCLRVTAGPSTALFEAFSPRVDLAVMTSVESCLRRLRLTADRFRLERPMTDDWHTSVVSGIDRIETSARRVLGEQGARPALVDGSLMLSELEQTFGRLRNASTLARVEPVRARLRELASDLSDPTSEADA